MGNPIGINCCPPTVCPIGSASLSHSFPRLSRVKMPGMSIVLPVLVVAFVAFCVGLTVRVINQRERWAKRTAVAVIVVLAAYPLSFGPWCWTIGHPGQEWGAGSKGDLFYQPLLRLWCYGPGPIRQSLK